MDGANPVDVWLCLHLWLKGLHLLGHLCLRLDEVYLCQKVVRVQHLLHVGAQLVAEYRQDADNLSALLSLQFTNLVVSFYHLGRFYEYCLARCRLVVHDTLDASFQSWRHGNHQSTVAQRGCNILCYQSVALCRVQYSI